MTSISMPLRPVALAVSMALHSIAATAQTPAPTTAEASPTLSTVTVEASADASAEGLAKPFAGGQVARGARVGILGTQDLMNTPFSITSYTSDLIQNQQARSVGDVLQNDPTIRVARSLGNFQESYFIRGFIVSSDDVAYNGLFGLVPRQYISSELFERVDVLRGASGFLNGASPAGGGIGGTVNLVPKRAPNEPLTRLTLGAASGSQAYGAVDVARRFGPDQATGIRVNAAHRDGGTGLDGEHVKSDMLSVGLDWRSRDVRLSADIGFQDHRLRGTRPNVTIGAAALRTGVMPAAPDNEVNYAQPWTYSNERNTFGTVRAEYDIDDAWTVWGAVGARRSDEANSLAGVTLTNSVSGEGTYYRFDNTRKDSVDTTEIGVRGKLRTGPVNHTLVAVGSYLDFDRKTAYATATGTPSLTTNIYNPRYTNAPRPLTATQIATLDNPVTTGRVRLTSFALGDTAGFLEDTVLVTLGARQQKFDVSTYAFGTGALIPPIYRKQRVSPAAGIVVKAREDVSLYADYIEGISQGETVLNTSLANYGQALPPYVSKQKEIGLKYDGGRIGGGIAAFSTDKPRAVDENNVRLVKGQDQHQGVEFTGYGELMRGLRLLGGLTLLKTAQQDTGTATTEGKQVIGVPRRQATLGVEWDVPFVRGLTLDARAIATGSRYVDAINSVNAPGWVRYDLGARYLTEIQGKLVTFRARIDNAGNRSYWSSVGGYPNSGYLVAGAPRTFSLNASVDF